MRLDASFWSVFHWIFRKEGKNELNKLRKKDAQLPQISFGTYLNMAPIFPTCKLHEHAAISNIKFPRRRQPQLKIVEFLSYIIELPGQSLAWAFRGILRASEIQEDTGVFALPEMVFIRFEGDRFLQVSVLIAPSTFKLELPNTGLIHGTLLLQNFFHSCHSRERGWEAAEMSVDIPANKTN